MSPTNRAKSRTPPVIRKFLKHKKYCPFFDKFLSYPEIEKYLLCLDSRYTKKDVPKCFSLNIIGKSKNGQNIYLLHVFNPQKLRRSIMIEAGLNGQDWLAVSTVLYIINEILSQPNLTNLYDYYIIPCMNPDGYQSSFGSKVRDVAKFSKFTNVKMDISNKFHIFPNSEDKLACIYEFIRMTAARIPEAASLVEILAEHAITIEAYFSLQMKGQNICYPFACRTSKLENADVVKKIAQIGCKALSVKEFRSGTLHELKCLKFGNVIDFIKTYFPTVKFCYIVNVGSQQDCNKIMKTGQKVHKAFKLMVKNIFFLSNKDAFQSTVFKVIKR